MKIWGGNIMYLVQEAHIEGYIWLKKLVKTVRKMLCYETLK